MVYHYLSWSLPLGTFTASTFFGRVGIYGVSMFYILSGLTLFHVYYNKMLPSKGDLIDFIKKRLFRIFPMLWFATILGIILGRQFPDVKLLILNLTGLYGIIKWDGSLAVGAWSVGNELVFYIFFPFFVLFSKKSMRMFLILSLAILGIYLIFAFHVLDKNKSLTSQWRDYVNPLNQVFLFLSGFLIGLIFRELNIRRTLNLAIFFTGLCLFLFYPSAGDTIQLVTGINRLVFTLSCILICIAFYKLNARVPVIVHKPLILLGETSYSIYLLHPIVFNVVEAIASFSEKHFLKLPQSVWLLSSVLFTLVIAYFVYHYIEKYFMSIARKNNAVINTNLQ